MRTWRSSGLGSSAVAIAAIVAAGCSPPITLGHACERTSECTAPLVCGAGRCREECREHRDCPLASRCLAGNDGIGVCTLEGDRCDDARPCGEDLQCRAGGCYDACPLGTCPTGGICVTDVCERPSAVPDAGTDGSGTVDAAGGGFPERRACSSDGECGAGWACGRVRGGSFTCRQTCAGLSDCSPGDTAIGCVSIEAIAGGTQDVCTLTCDLFAGAAGCPSGETCDALELPTRTGLAIGIDCRPIDPAMLGQGASCATGSDYDPTLCAPLFDCDGTPPSFECQQLCTVGGALGPLCPPGTSCQGFLSVRYMRASLGSCDPG